MGWVFTPFFDTKNTYIYVSKNIMEKIFENISNLPWWAILIILLILVPLYLFKEPLSKKEDNILDEVPFDDG